MVAQGVKGIYICREREREREREGGSAPSRRHIAFYDLASDVTQNHSATSIQGIYKDLPGFKGRWGASRIDFTSSRVWNGKVLEEHKGLEILLLP